MNSWSDLSIKDRADIMKVAVRNGITKLSDIRDKYNAFAEGGNLYDGGGYFGKMTNVINKKADDIRNTAYRPSNNGSWISRHQRRWYDYLLRQGVSGQDAQRLSGFFAAQDALESAGGTSSAARTKNNFGGMQKGGKNIYYASPEAYMDAKWRMMNRTFSDALGAKTIDEYATLLGDPNRVGRGRSLYYVTDKVALDAKSPIWQAAQTKHMHDYINGMRTWAGKGRINFNDPDISATYVPEIPEGYIFPDERDPFEGFTPSNPQAFFATSNNYPDLRTLLMTEAEEKKNPAEELYSQEALAREEKQRGINNLFTVMGLLNQGNSEDSSSILPFGLPGSSSNSNVNLIGNLLNG